MTHTIPTAVGALGVGQLTLKSFDASAHQAALLF